MDLKVILMARADEQCELCEGKEGLDIYQIEPVELAVSECQILVCSTCQDALAGKEIERAHWQCLKKAVHSDYLSVQVVSYRVLKSLEEHQGHDSWVTEALNTFDFDDLTLEWAQAQKV